jgi:hypothetical protein
MKLFLHRANDAESIARAAANGWGIEVDVRWHQKRLLLEHDPIHRPDSRNLFEARLGGFPGEVILDVKETGLIPVLVEAIRFAGIPLARVYATDLIVPDMLRAERLGLRTLARCSPYEDIHGPFHGYWVDYVRNPNEVLFGDKPAFLVSPELHAWPLEDEFVHACAELPFAGVCTDFPETWNHDRRRDQQRTDTTPRAA